LYSLSSAVKCSDDMSLHWCNLIKAIHLPHISYAICMMGRWFLKETIYCQLVRWH
jgi:hypothetical protein